MTAQPRWSDAAFTGRYDEHDGWVTTGVTVWPPPTAHNSDGRCLSELSYDELRAKHQSWRRIAETGYWRRSLDLELYRKNPRPPSFESYWTADTGWVPCATKT